MVVGTDSGLVGEVNGGSHLCRLSLDLGEGHGLPVPDGVRVLFVGPRDRALRGHAEATEQPAHGLLGQVDLEKAPDQLTDHPASPQREVETKLPGIFPEKRRVQATNLVLGEFRRSSRNRFGKQRVGTTVFEQLHPAVNRGLPQSEGSGDVFHGGAMVHDLVDRAYTDILKRLVVQLTAVVFAHSRIQPHRM